VTNPLAEKAPSGSIEKVFSIGGSRIFFTGGLKDEFIRMCTDCILAVKTQLLRKPF